MRRWFVFLKYHYHYCFFILEPKHVYTVKDEALKVMKLSKKARFKQFKTYQEALEFAELGAEIIPNSTPTQQVNNFFKFGAKFH